MSEEDLDAKIKANPVDSLRLEKAWRLISSDLTSALQNKKVEFDGKILTTEEKEKDRKKRLPEFGTAEDFMLTQASAYLKGQPVKRSKSRLE